MVADSKFVAIFATLVLVWTPLVRGDSNDLKCYDSDGWKTLGSQKEVSCPKGTCEGAWTQEPGKDEKKGALMCQPHWEISRNFTESDWEEYDNKRRSIGTNQEKFFKTLLKTAGKISATGFGNPPFPGISINGKGTGYIKDILIGQVIAGDPFSEKRKVKLEVDANIGAIEFQVKLDQELQFDTDGKSNFNINKKNFGSEGVLVKICIGQPQVCTLAERDPDLTIDHLESFERAVLTELGSNSDVTLTWGDAINFRITGNFKPLVENYQKVRKAISENQRRSSDGVALKNAIEEIIGDITLEAKANVEIDESTRAEVNINGNSKELLKRLIKEEEETPEYAYKICTEKKCLHHGLCRKTLCNHPEKLVKMANSAEGVKLTIVFMALNLLFLTKL